jgi:hypothetical protein
MSRSFLTRMLWCSMIASLPALATETVPPSAAAFRVADMSDEAPTSAAQGNPSKIEPMMIEPSPEQTAAAYRRDLASCDRQSGTQQACREAVNARYGTEINPFSAPAKCDALDGAARTECLNGAGAGGQ